jgi:hypothetical protein
MLASDSLRVTISEDNVAVSKKILKEKKSMA